MKAWYFSNGYKLGNGDGREIAAGVIHVHNGPLRMCRSGLHASTNILDALGYAPGSIIWRVNVSGDIIRGDDKLVVSRREYLWGYNATDVLQHFARLCALDVIHLWNAPQIVIDYLKTGDEELRAAAWAAARDAAWDAARDAARDAAWDAGRAAARAAAWAAGRDAGQAAARAAARDAAWDAGRDAGRDAQSRRLYRMIMSGRP